MLHRALVDRYTAYATVITTWPLRKLFWPYIYIGRAFYTVLYYYTPENANSKIPRWGC